MSRHSDGPGWELYEGDCIAGMRELADRSVDVVITDPPYEAEAHTKQRRTLRATRDPNARRRPGEALAITEPLPFAAIIESQRLDVATEIARVAKRWVLAFCQVESTRRWADAFVGGGLEYIRTMVWIKPDGLPQYTGDRPGMGYESIVVAHRKGRKRWNGGGRHGVFEYNKNGGPGPAPHPTTKPQPLMRELVSLFSEPDDLILDAFAGSGSTGVAAVALGRRFVGYELNAGYFDIACRRLRGDEAVPRKEQPGLFDTQGTP